MRKIYMRSTITHELQTYEKLQKFQVKHMTYQSQLYKENQLLIEFQTINGIPFELNQETERQSGNTGRTAGVFA